MTLADSLRLDFEHSFRNEIDQFTKLLRDQMQEAIGKGISKISVTYKPDSMKPGLDVALVAFLVNQGFCKVECTAYNTETKAYGVDSNSYLVYVSLYNFIGI